jgi:DNA-binding transcriptional regulator LsrR (DeoR family)
MIDEKFIEDICEMYSTGEFTQKNLSEIFGISLTTINKIVRCDPNHENNITRIRFGKGTSRRW